jgi:hypothetical protein
MVGVMLSSGVVWQWQPIASAPANGTAVLLFHPNWDIPRVGLRYGKTGKWQQPDGDLMRTPAYWMKLPDPPESPAR